MSGGVDSSASAILLKQQGYEVIGATMLLWKEQENSNAVQDAKNVCDLLEIPHIVLDLRDTFQHCVVQHFITEYKDGRTPNPCVQCNKYLKFGCFYEKAIELGCDFIATGHYARIEDSAYYQQRVLKKSKEIEKDQSYFLYGIPKPVLSHILFPLQNYTEKSKIRQLASCYHLPVATKKDSQEICFITDNAYTKFLEKQMEQLPKQGKFVLKDGTIVGTHKGIIYYTIGQRKGLGISYQHPLYVVEIDKTNNTIVLGEEKELFSTQVKINNLNFLVPEEKIPEKRLQAKIRYRSKEAACKIRQKKQDSLILEFDIPQRAVAKGQSVVLYDEDIVLGGGIIV